MAQQRTVTRDMPKLSHRASFVPSTFDAEQRTIEVTWTTGAAVLRGGLWTEPYYEELSLDPKHVRMGRLSSGNAPFLAVHDGFDLDAVIGVVESARLDPGGKTGSATIRFARTPEGEKAMGMVADGILRNISVGYSTFKMQEVDRGKDAAIPTFLAVDWEPAELSLVPIPADAGATTRSGATTTPCEFVEERAMDPENPTPTSTPAPVATPTPPTPVPAPSDPQARAAAVTEERERVLGIQRAGRALQRPEEEVKAAIERGTSLAEYNAAAINARANAAPEQGGVIPFQRGGSHVTAVAGEDSRDKMLRGMTAWIIQRAAVAHIHQDAAKKTGEKVDLDPGEFRGMKLLDIARKCLELAGVRTAGMTQMELAGAALSMRAGSTGGLATVADFPMILENALYKTLLAQYGVTPDTWSRFCMAGSVQDFRANKRYRMGTFGSLSALNEAGEFASKSIPDAERQSITAATKGNLIGISRQAIINDDMQAFSSLATMLGRAAKLTVEQDVYALLASNSGLGPTMNDGLTLFHTTHKNISTQAAIGSTAIDADRVQMASQTDPSGNEVLNLTPAILVLPIGLGGVARQINTAQYDFDASASKNPWVPNKVGNLFRDIVDTARLSGNRRYLFADPGIAPTIEVAFLDGQQQPFMDMQQGWRVDGIEWKVRLDYAVGAIDFRGAVTNAG